MCGLVRESVDSAKIESTLRAIYQYNLKHDLSEHANTRRPTYAVGAEGGLPICTWPRGGKPCLPFVYSDEVWTGTEYSTASYTILHGLVEEGLDVVRTCRRRYDAVDKTLCIDSKVGPDFRSFLSTATGYGSAGLKNGKPFVEVRKGFIDIEKVMVSGRPAAMAR